jgi:hypothetical protein
MAQFQKGGPDGLEHAIGIVHGYVGAWGYEAMYLSLIDI